jgi:hypothetical protein
MRWLLLLLLVLVGCQSEAATPIVESTRPDLENLIEWDRSPSTVIFRAEVIGGSSGEFYMRNEVPYCTVYGNNDVVWTTSGARSDDKVVWDKVSDDEIRRFVESLTLGFGIYSYKTGTELVSSGTQVPVLERLTLFVNGVLHQTDALSGWDYAYFQKILTLCRSLSDSPVLYEPRGAWVAAQQIEYNSSVPSSVWNEAETGVSLSQLASSGERKWIEGKSVVALWNAIRSGGMDIQFETDNGTYLVTVEVPNITRSSPPAP